MSINYHGEVFDDGRRFLTISSEAGRGLVTIKFGIGLEWCIAARQALELSRHLALAAHSTSEGDK